MGLELRAVETGDEPLVAVHPDIPAELALQGFDGVRAYATEPDASRPFLEETLVFEPRGDARLGGAGRGARLLLRLRRASGRARALGRRHGAPRRLVVAAWRQHEAWRERAAQGGARPTPVIDRFYFRSIYFREPSGVLFEIATLGPGFTADEPLESLGEALSLPPAYEPLRERLEHVLTPLPDPRPARTAQ